MYSRQTGEKAISRVVEGAKLLVKGKWKDWEAETNA
jgi:hypothetical protein